nr:MAG TPA: hypothetical protein [Caudoviricetes sp.]
MNIQILHLNLLFKELSYFLSDVKPFNLFLC